MSELHRRNATEQSSKNAIEPPTINLRYGPMPSFPNQKRFARYIIIASLVVIVYFYSPGSKEKMLAARNAVVEKRVMMFACDKEFTKDIRKFPDCEPRRCGRGVYDNVVSREEVEALSRIAGKGLSLSRPLGGVAILDLHSGALSLGHDFVNVYKATNLTAMLEPHDFLIYKRVRKKIEKLVAEQFAVSSESLYLTHPTFFSQLTSLPAQSPHDEYWHLHVDKETYQTFHYTALLYLSTAGIDFSGGNFEFADAYNVTWIVEPKLGRILVFSSGAENTHRVQQVTDGVRTALTIAFTCHRTEAISDPSPILHSTK